MSYAAIKGALNGVTDAGSNIFMLFAPQSVRLPYIVVQRISQVVGGHTFDGPTDVEAGRYQVTYWTDDATKLPAAEKAIRAALRRLDDSFVEGLSDDAEAPASGEARTYARRFEVEVWGVAQEA